MVLKIRFKALTLRYTYFIDLFGMLKLLYLALQFVLVLHLLTFK